MAIGTDAGIEFFGTKDVLGTTTSAVTDGSFSAGTGDLVAWTNDDDAPEAAFALEFTTATTGDANSSLLLHARLMNVGSAGTEDEEVPDANFTQHFLGFFSHNNPSTGAQTAALRAVLPNTVTSQVYEFYVENLTGQTISAGWELSVTPISIGPHA